MDKQQTMAMMNCSVDNDFNIGIDTTENSGTFTALDTSGNCSSRNYSCWDYWHREYYPLVIRESYPVYSSERAKDKGKQAFEIIKILKDKKLVNIEKVSDFIEIMDTLIKIL